MAVFPFGLVVGFTITALPFLLTNLGIPALPGSRDQRYRDVADLLGISVAANHGYGVDATRLLLAYRNQLCDLPGSGAGIALACTSDSSNGPPDTGGAGDGVIFRGDPADGLRSSHQTSYEAL